MEITIYPPAIRDLLAPERLPELGPGTPNAAAHERLRRLTADALFAPAPLRDRAMAECCLAGLWLWHDYLDESHRISQDLESVEGSYWHGIMHRREPDYGNAKYWFRRVRHHPIHADLAKFAADLWPGGIASSGKWDPFAFVDLCEQAVEDGGEVARVCKEIQRCEWELLFEYCRWAAVGGNGP